MRSLLLLALAFTGQIWAEDLTKNGTSLFDTQPPRAANHDEINRCYDEYLGRHRRAYVNTGLLEVNALVNRDRRTQADVMLSFRILPTGMTENVSVLKSSIEEPQFRACVQRTAGLWRFTKRPLALEVGKFPVLFSHEPRY